MNEVTRILFEIESGNSEASAELLPHVYASLRSLAQACISNEKPGHTLQATALVHEAYLRLVDHPQPQRWDSRNHFFAAASEAMRRILVEAARRKKRIKHGGEMQRELLVEEAIELTAPADELLAVHDALDELEEKNQQAATLVKLRYFGGFTIPEAAEQLGVSPRKANQIWAYARAWLAAEIAETQS